MYRVVGMDGQVYGPVDLPTLQRWCVEGRVAPMSTVIDDRNGQQFLAQSISSLNGCFSLQTQNPPGPSNPGGPANPYTAYPRPMYSMGASPKSKTVAIILAIPCLLGPFGIHRFYLGHNSSAIAMLALTLFGLCCHVGIIIAIIWSLVDIIMIATDSLVDASGQRLS